MLRRGSVHKSGTTPTRKALYCDRKGCSNHAEFQAVVWIMDPITERPYVKLLADLTTCAAHRNDCGALDAVRPSDIEGTMRLIGIRFAWFDLCWVAIKPGDRLDDEQRVRDAVYAADA